MIADHHLDLLRRSKCLLPRLFVLAWSLVCFRFGFRLRCHLAFRFHTAKLIRQEGTCKLLRHNFPSQRNLATNRFQRLYKKIADTHSKRIRDSMQPPKRRSFLSADKLAHSLVSNTQLLSQFPTTYVFSHITGSN